MLIKGDAFEKGVEGRTMPSSSSGLDAPGGVSDSGAFREKVNPMGGAGVSKPRNGFAGVRAGCPGVAVDLKRMLLVGVGGGKSSFEGAISSPSRLSKLDFLI